MRLEFHILATLSLKVAGDRSIQTSPALAWCSPRSHEEDCVLLHTEYCCSEISCHCSKPFHMFPFWNSDDRHLLNSTSHTNPNQKNREVVGAWTPKATGNTARAPGFKITVALTHAKGFFLLTYCIASPTATLSLFYASILQDWRNDAFTGVNERNSLWPW